MLVISTREFRAKQSDYLARAKQGEDVVLKSRGNGSFKIVPVTENDIVIEKKYILSPDDDFFRAISIEEFTAGAKEHIRKLYKQDKK